ncbi:MAG TPA: ABC transporter ATP-binding protein [Caproiciproducens sp.]|nr:ABC transporter ATP-binding protein [Caproiciproducens sp.]
MSLSVDHLSFGFSCRKVLDNVCFRAENGNLVCLLGSNGAGKSTLFRCILGILPYRQGSVRVDGKEILSLPVKERARKIAYIPQSHSDVFPYSALEMVLMGTASQLGCFSSPGREQVARARKAMELLGICHLERCSYSRLSGGERQLVLIARAVAQQTGVLIMDEPCSSLDYGNQLHILEQMKNLARQGYLVLMSTHNPEQALLFADQVLVLRNHRIICSGSPKEVLSDSLLEQIYGVPVSVHRVGAVPVCIPHLTGNRG